MSLLWYTELTHSPHLDDWILSVNNDRIRIRAKFASCRLRDTGELEAVFLLDDDSLEYVRRKNPNAKRFRVKVFHYDTNPLLYEGRKKITLEHFAVGQTEEEARRQFDEYILLYGSLRGD